MADICTIYTSKKKLELVDFFAKNDLDAKVSFFSSDKKGKWEKIEIKWHDLIITVKNIERGEADFEPEVDGLCNYIFYLSNQKITNRSFMLIEKIQRTNHVLGIIAEPGFDNEKRWEKVVSGISSFLKGVAFKDFLIYDNALKLILGKENTFDESSEIPVFEAALIRKKNSEEKLQKMKIPVDINLPPIISVEEINMRPPSEIAARISILLLLASRLDGIKADFITKFIQANNLWDYITPNEKIFLQNKKPEKQELINYNWRYESAQVLIWALGYIDKLIPPDLLCNPEELVSLINRIKIPDLMNKSKLRSENEILDEADMTYRLHCAVKNCNDEKILKSIDPGVIYERHYAFNWLINYMNEKWDDISTNT